MNLWIMAKSKEECLSYLERGWEKKKKKEERMFRNQNPNYFPNLSNQKEFITKIYFKQHIIRHHVWFDVLFMSY